ncbi:hypothetical protein [Actinacidiphila sp. ITFR-21]|uniref:hypothetical protein n=1 Tax=Actinacidiphila sp. ITFR-21 TaxID=3075199 RepID=UPI00288A6390|nr:hypothetical protein [Streptomyces sp. ITFR-21]WNI15589.1 hypothetical protein RLT57_08640 [Streptomyces sp. ITFR-21]
MSRIVRYVGGPLDGQEMDVAAWPEDSVRRGVYQVVDGWADRADYEPEPGGDPLLWLYRGPVPG